MKKIVINKCHGGFSLSHECMMEYAKNKGIKLYPEKNNYGHYTYWTVPKKKRMNNIDNSWYKLSIEERYEYNKKYRAQTICEYDLLRDDPDLVKAVEKLGEAASADVSELKIVEIPDNVAWHIEEYDGSEWIAENHRTWS